MPTATGINRFTSHSSTYMKMTQKGPTMALWSEIMYGTLQYFTLISCGYCLCYFPLPDNHLMYPVHPEKSMLQMYKMLKTSIVATLDHCSVSTTGREGGGGLQDCGTAGRWY